MLSLETLVSWPVIGGIFIWIDKRINNKVDRKECLRVHEELNERLKLIHEDTQYLRENFKNGLPR